MPTSSATKRRKKRARPAPKPAQAYLIPKTAVGAPAGAAPKVSDDFLRLRIAPAILLTLMTFSIYFQVIHHPFANYDDGEYVAHNPSVQRGVTLATIRWAFTSTERANWHPLTWLSHSLDWQLFGDNPSGHHFTSLLLHVLNVLLLYFFLTRITGSTVRSLLVAGLFAVHPINVESVAWIAERKNVLCTLFFLLALIAYARYAQRPNLGRYLGMALLFALALTAKPMVVTFPFVLLLLDFWPLQRIKDWTLPSAAFPAPQFPAWRIALEKVPLLALSVADSVLTVIAQNKVSAIKSVTKFSLSARLANAVVSYVAYLWKAVWPTHLAVFYPHFAGRTSAWQLLLCGLLLVAISAAVWRERLHPYLIFGWCWFLGMMVPVIGLVQVGDQGMADRYAYLPFIGLFVGAVWGLADVVQNAGGGIRRYAPVAAGVVLMLFSVLAWRQARTWRSPFDLWSQTLAVDPNNSVAEDVVGSEILMSALNKGLKSSDAAQVHFQNALRLNPKDPEALLNIGVDLQAHDQLQEAIADYKQALQYAQDDPPLKGRILTDLGSAYERLPDLGTARQYYRQALKLGPDNAPTAFEGFARTFTDQQIADLTQTLAAQPTAQGFLKLGQLQEAGGNTEKAKAAYQRALAMDPKLEAAQSALDRLSNAGH